MNKDGSVITMAVLGPNSIWNEQIALYTLLYT